MISDIYALSPIQAGMLFHRLFAPDSTAYFDQFSCRLSGDVDAGRLGRAWQALVDRHPVLRTSFHWEGLEHPVQVVHDTAALPWNVLDWRTLAPEAQLEQWHAHLAADRARGFDPGVAPLMRVTLARISESDYYCCWSHHHLLLDGWCLTLVLSELFEWYDALRADRPPTLAPVRPYADYINWWQQRDHSETEDYWRQTLSGMTATTTLSPSRPATPVGGRTYASRERQLGEELTAALRALAARRRLTLSTLVQGAWALALSRYSGTDDVVFGATVSGRPPELPGIETMLGVFINTVPVRLSVPAEIAAAQWLADVQARHVEREAHATLPLTDIQKLSDVEPGTPLFESNVIVMNYRLDERLAHGAAGLEVSELRIFDETDVPLTLQVTPGARVGLEIVFDRARFDEPAVDRMLGHVEFLLAQFVADLDRPLSAFEIVTPGERAQLFDEFNATAAPLDQNQTVISVWETRVAQTPDATAVVCENVRLTYAQLDDWANRLARSLRSVVPSGTALGPDALVAVAFKRSERLIAAILAIWKCGAAYVPIDPDYPTDRIRQVLDAATPLIVLRDEGTLDAALERDLGAKGRACFTSVAALDRLETSDRVDVSSQPARSGDLAYVIFTSGSTGTPKGAMVEHLGMLNHLLAKVEDFNLDRRSVIVQNASHCFDISVWQCFAALMAGGCTVVYIDDLVLDPVQFLERVRTDRVTVLEVVPSYLAPLLDRFEDDPRPLPDLQFLLVTGETVKPALVERWFACVPSVPMANAYGPTEASDDITHAIMHVPPVTPTVPIGRPVRNFHIYVVQVVGETPHLCPIGIAGELWVSGPGVGRGYLGDPARTAVVFQEDVFRSERGVRMYRTGDLGWFTEDGTLLLAGRKDYQVKVRGYRIELGDIEIALAGLDGIGDAVVVDWRDPGSDAVSLAAYVSVRDSSLTSRRILESLASRLPDYMIPASCLILDRLPLTPNGKINRKALPAPERGAGADRLSHVAPSTTTEQQLSEIWADVLGVDNPGVHDNFFAVGGDSILSMQIVSRASRLGLVLTPRDVFQHQTIAGLAAVARVAPVATPVSGPRPTSAPLTPAQRQFFEDVTVDRHHYNQSILLEVPPGFDVARCERALDAVIGHHESLRLRFTHDADGWRQSVEETASRSQVPVFALADVPADQRARQVETLGAQVQASLDLDRGPLIGAAVFDFGPAEAGRLLIAAHHLSVDGVSWRVLLDDLTSAYAALAEHDSVVLPPVPTPFLDWAATLTPSTPVPAPSGTGDNQVSAVREQAIVLDATATRRLLTVAPEVYQAGPTDVLLAASALAYADWSGAPHVSLDLETHGRDAAGGYDLTRTVGWLTATTSIPFDRETVGDNPTLAVTHARDQRQAAAASGTSTAFRSRVLFNYHGQIDASQRRATGRPWVLSGDPHGPDRSPRQTREYDIEINGVVSGGCLRLVVAFSVGQHSDEAMALLMRHLEQRLGVLSEGVGVDSPLATLLSSLPDVQEAYALSPTQQGLLFHGLVEETRESYFNQLTCVLNGPLDVDAFTAAWQTVTDRHPVLRTSFHWHGLSHPAQVVHARADIPWTVEDWSSLAPDEQSRRWTGQGRADRQRPFDLSQAPLMRCTLCRVSATSYRFRWSQHHLLLDGWSSSIVLGDVLEAYHRLVEGHPVDAESPRPYRDYIGWLTGQDHDAAADFWRRSLAGFERATPLVLGLPEMEGRVEPGPLGEVEVQLSEARSARVKAMAAESQITLHTLFQGVWSLLLSRHSGETDVVFGAIASGRPAALDGADQMVGLFINTVPVRVGIDDRASVTEWLRHLQQESAERDEFAFSSLADVQRQSDVPGGAPLFDTILIFENYPVASSLSSRSERLSIGDVQAREPNNYPVTCVVTPGAAIALKLMFDAGRFDEVTIERMMQHVLTILDGLVNAPDDAVGTVACLTAAELDQIRQWNATARPLPPGETVLSRVEAHARVHPDGVAVRCGNRTTTYGELNARAARLAEAMVAAADLSTRSPHEPAPRVVVLMRRSERWPETVCAVWKCGAVYVPVDPEYPAARIATIIADARPALLVADAGDLGAERLAGLRGLLPVLCVDEVDAAPTGRSADLTPPTPEDLAYIIYTSGSTGAPKGAMVEHVGFFNHVQSMCEEFDLSPTSVVAQTASHCFDISMWQMFAALTVGGTTVIYPESLVLEPVDLAARLDEDRVEVVQFVPSYLSVFLDAMNDVIDGDSPPAFEALAHMVVIGEALKPAVAERWFALYPDIPLMNTYGPTEASDSVAHIDFTRPLGTALVPIGFPVQNMALYVVDRAMRLCGIGVKGEIAIAGVGVGRGYLFDTARTEKAFRTNPFGDAGGRLYLTGDIGCYRPDGALLFFGRRDHQVKVRGFRIELGEIESCLTDVAEVQDAVVVASAQADGDSLLCAYVVPDAGSGLDEATITRELADRLPRHAMPHVIRLLPEFPRLPSGKVDRRGLQARPIVRAEAVAADVPPSATQERVARIWADVLGRQDIGVDQSLFDVGGHSLKAIQIVSRINRDCDVDLGVADVFEHPTVRALAQRVASAAAASSVALVPTALQADYDTSPTQRRMWLASRTASGSAAYNMAGVFWLVGQVDIDALQRAFSALVARHEALRTVFVVAGGELRQQVKSPAATDSALRSIPTPLPTEPASLDAFLSERIAAPFDLEQGPLFDADLFPEVDGRRLLLVRLHHIVGDAASIRLVLDEALVLYRAFRRALKDDAPRTPLPPLSIQYRDFVAWQNRLTDEGAREPHRRYWRDRLSAPLPRTGFPPDRPRSASQGPVVPAVLTATVELDEVLTTRVRAVASHHGTTVFSVVVSALYALLHRSTQQEDLLIGSTVSRRDHPLLETQVGCYIDTIPLRGSAAGRDTAGALLDRTARVCRTALEHRDYPFETLLEDLDVAVAGDAPPLFDVLVDYVPRGAAASADATDAGLSVSEHRLSLESAHYNTMCLIADSDDGVRVLVQVVLPADQYDASTVDGMQSRLRTLLEWIADDGVVTLGEVALLAPATRPRRRLHIGLKTS